MAEITTDTMIDAGLDILAAHSLMADWRLVVADVYAAMKAVAPPPGPNPADIIFAPKRMADWPLPSNSVSDSGCTIGEISIFSLLPSELPTPPSGNEYVIRAKLSGSGSDYARMQFNHDSAGVPAWGEGTDVWYSASFYLPVGFYASKNSTKDIMRWDAYDGAREQDMQGGLGMGTDDALYIMSNYPYSRPVETGYIIPEGKWTSIEVHQKLSENPAIAQNEIYADGELVGMSTVPNYKGSAYAAIGQNTAINRIRVGLVSEGSVSDANTLYFDKFVISKVPMTRKAV
jgi:hypothetical protein